MASISFFTSESVCAGHPDKICDQISDAILDQVLRQDPLGRVAVETLVTTDKVVLAGEVTTTATVNFEQVTREQIKRLGYTKEAYQFWHHSPIEVLIHHQSPEIAAGVDQEGAGDQGMMFGFASHETPQYMPLAITLAHALTTKIDQVRENGPLTYLRPDGKSQVTVRYENGVAVGIEKVVVAVPHEPEVGLAQVKTDIYQEVVQPVLAGFGFQIDQTSVILNGTGVWHQGGPAADTGVTGRKIVVDTYGGYARVGGGCFSGKDPTKVDRSGAYAARYIAKNIVAHGLAKKAEVGLAYCIGQAQPVMKSVETFDTQKVTDEVLADFVDTLIDCSVRGILTKLDLRRPIYLPTAAYGHFGRDIFPWEKITE